jgi:hypothetical protein
MKMKKALVFLSLLLAALAASNVLAEVPDAFTLAWTDFEFKNRDLLSIQSPVLRGQVGDKSMTEGGQFLIAQNWADENQLL